MEDGKVGKGKCQRKGKKEEEREKWMSRSVSFVIVFFGHQTKFRREDRTFLEVSLIEPRFSQEDRFPEKEKRMKSNVPSGV